jgi:hypothetical protein
LLVLCGTTEAASPEGVRSIKRIPTYLDKFGRYNAVFVAGRPARQ